MKIKVTSVSNGWKPDNAGADFKPIYTLTAEGQGEPIKTQDEKLAVIGEHDAETYQTKSNKTYWRTVEAAQAAQEASERQFKADPVKQESVEWQTALNRAVDTVRDWHTLAQMTDGYKLPALSDYKRAVVECVVTYTQTIATKPEVIETVNIRREGDFTKINPVDDDLPPVEAYDEAEAMQSNPLMDL